MKHAPAPALIALVVLAAALGRPDSARVRPSPPRAAPEPSRPAFAEIPTRARDRSVPEERDLAGIPDRDLRASAFSAVLRSGSDADIEHCAGFLWEETDADVVASSVRALTGNGSPAAVRLATEIAARHPNPVVRRKLEESDSGASCPESNE